MKKEITTVAEPALSRLQMVSSSAPLMTRAVLCAQQLGLMASAISSAVAGHPAGASAANRSRPSPIEFSPFGASRSGTHGIDADATPAIFSRPRFSKQIDSGFA